MTDEETKAIDARIEALEKALGLVMTVIGRHPDVLRELIAGLRAYEAFARRENAHPEQVDLFRRAAEWMQSVRDDET